MDWRYQKPIPVKKALYITSSGLQGVRELLKLVQCEFAKLKRKKIIPLVFLSAFLFPIPITFLMATPRMLEKYPNKAVLFDGLFNMVMGYGVTPTRCVVMTRTETKR